jgi:NitT/TauT family transport system substrate-binding protein
MSKLSLSVLIAAVVLATSASAKAEDLVVTQYRGDPSGAPYAVSIDKGFFKKAGIEIEIVSGEGGGTSVRNVIASDLGYGETSPAGVITAILEGLDIKIVNLGSRSMASNVIIVMPNSPIKTVADLKGKKFGISAPKSLGEMTGVLAMEKAGLKPDDMQRIALGGLAGALTALENGVVDATSVPGVPFLARGGESKYRVLVGPKDLPLLPPAIGIASGKLMKGNPAKLRAIIAGRREGVKYIYDNKQDVLPTLYKLYAPLPEKDIATLVGQLVDAKFWSEGKIEMELLQNTVRAMKYVGMLSSDPDLTKMIDTSFLPADLQK